MRLRPRLVALSCAVVMLAGGGTASADRYVSKLAPPGNTECASPASACDTITKAITAATTGETVTIGPGTYAENVYEDKRLTFAGAGSGPVDGPASLSDTVLTGSVTLIDTAGISKVRIENQFGLSVGQQSPVKDRTVAVSDVVVRAQSVGFRALDQTLGGKLSAVVERSAFVQTGADNGFEFVTGLGTSNGGDAISLTLRDVTVRSNDKFGVTTDGGALTLEGVDLAEAGPMFAVANSVGPTVIRRSRIAGGRIGVFVDGGPLTVSDSTVRVRQDTGADAYAVFAGNTVETPVTITGSTIDAAGAKIAMGIRAWPSLTITNSVVLMRDTTSATLPGIFVPSPGPGMPGPLAISHTAVKTINIGDGPEAPPAAGANLTADPKLVDPAGGDLTLAADSPLIDAGDPAVLTAGELDLAGAARSLDGNGDCAAVPDIGAYERPTLVNPACTPPAPQPPAPAPAGATPPKDTAAPPVTAAAIAASGGGPATAATLTFTLGEPADVVVTLETSAKPGAAAVRWRTLGTILKKRLKAGRQKVKVPRKVKGRRLKRGSYRLRIRATDAAGNVTTKLVAFKLKR